MEVCVGSAGFGFTVAFLEWREEEDERHSNEEESGCLDGMCIYGCVLGAVTENWGHRLRKDRGTIERLRQEIMIGLKEFWNKILNPKLGGMC